jgi:hypothetical protein
MNGNVVGAKTLAYLRGEKDLFEERKQLNQAQQRLKKSGLGYWLCNNTEPRARRFWEIVSLLEENSRMSLTEMSRKLRMPMSTLYDLLKEIEKFFCFTIVLKEDAKQALTPRYEFCYEFVETSAEAKEVPLSAYI